MSRSVVHTSKSLHNFLPILDCTSGKANFMHAPFLPLLEQNLYGTDFKKKKRKGFQKIN